MKKTWRLNFEMKMDESGENRGGWDIKAWTAGDAIREVIAILKSTAKDDKSKKIKGLSFSLIRKE